MCLNDCLIHVGKIPQTWVAVGFGSQAMAPQAESAPSQEYLSNSRLSPSDFRDMAGLPSLHFQILPGCASKDSDLRFSS